MTVGGRYETDHDRIRPARTCRLHQTTSLGASKVQRPSMASLRSARFSARAATERTSVDIVDKGDIRDILFGVAVLLRKITMSTTLEFIANHLPRVTVDDVRRFSATVEVRDARAFAAELQAFVHERLKAVELPLLLGALPVATTLEQTLARKAADLRADTRWVPGETDIQRGRAALLEAFDQPHNLPLPEFARLANKSRQQIYKDIDTRRLLALNVGPRGQKLPDWQLDSVTQQFTQGVLQRATEVDNWTLYRALSEPLEGLGGRSPIDVVTAASVDEVTKAVFNVLGIH